MILIIHEQCGASLMASTASLAASLIQEITQNGIFRLITSFPSMH